MKNLVIFIFLLFILQSCTLSSLQTGKTVPKGKNSSCLALSPRLFAIDYQYRQGISKHMDFGFAISNLIPQYFDLKYNFLPDSSKYALSLSTSVIPLMQFQTPLSFSYHPNYKEAWYFQTKYTVLSWWNFSDKETLKLGSFVAGTKLTGNSGKRSFLVETGIALPFNNPAIHFSNLFLFSMGIAWRLP
jgi:hypothetical protein